MSIKFGCLFTKHKIFPYAFKVNVKYILKWSCHVILCIFPNLKYTLSFIIAPPPALLINDKTLLLANFSLKWKRNVYINITLDICTIVEFYA